ncbi:hypothetical protein BY458DRAFT_531060 [Sporodiniella umbellata]|nr:hypothetical protein BY458DRAFT_531060 [Sporodiniella umbellata]
MPDLETIHLSGNTLGVEASQALAKALEGKTLLKKALLSDIFTGRLLSEIPLALKALCDAFEKVDLLELDLSDNAFGPAGARPLIDFLTNTKTLQTLRLNNNGLGIGGGAMVAQALQANADQAQAENRTSSLRKIICGRNRLEDGSCERLARAFASHGTLEVVRMPQNGIRPDGVATLVSGLEKCPGLVHLDLQDNTFTLKGSRALAGALKAWPQLQILNVSDCLLSKRGGLLVFESLIQNKQLKALLAQYNEIQADAIKVLVNTIKELQHLEKIELNGNRFEEDHPIVEELKEALAAWGHEDALDELDDMEEIDSEEEEEEEEEEEDKLVKEAEKAEAQTPNADKDQQDELVAQLKKTHI